LKSSTDLQYLCGFDGDLTGARKRARAAEPMLTVVPTVLGFLSVGQQINAKSPDF
jgi:hypothetical protein